VVDDETGVKTSAGSGGKPGHGYNSTTGQAVIVGDDPFALNITQVKTFTTSTFPYEGRYPCGQLVYKGHWFYGTYYLDNPNATVGGNYVGPSPGPDCTNWCIQGPLVDFRHSTDNGKTWAEARVNGSMESGKGDDNLFGETAANNYKVVFEGGAALGGVTLCSFVDLYNLVLKYEGGEHSISKLSTHIATHRHFA
jgi:hypothetical protein